MTVKLTDHKLMKKAMKASCKEQAKVMKGDKKKVEPEFEKTIGDETNSFIKRLKKSYSEVLKRLAKERDD